MGKHQIKHTRKSKYGKTFAAGHLPKFQVFLTYYNPDDAGSLATGDLFHAGKKVAWWDEDNLNEITIYWIRDKKMDVDEEMLKDYIRSKWRKGIDHEPRMIMPEKTEELEDEDWIY